MQDKAQYCGGNRWVAHQNAKYSSYKKWKEVLSYQSQKQIRNQQSRFTHQFQVWGRARRRGATLH